MARPMDPGEWGCWAGSAFLVILGHHVQAAGTFGTGGAVRPEGSNFVDQSAFFQLRDPGLTLISFTSADGKQIMEHTYLIRPHCTAGDGSTAIIVVMSLSSTGRRS